MERCEILAAMGELKLYGMKAAFDEILATAVKRQHRNCSNKPSQLYLFDGTAPMTAALCLRVSALPSLAKLSDKARKDYGDAYAGGQIGASMAKILND